MVQQLLFCSSDIPSSFIAVYGCHGVRLRFLLEVSLPAGGSSPARHPPSHLQPSGFLFHLLSLLSHMYHSVSASLSFHSSLFTVDSLSPFSLLSKFLQPPHPLPSLTVGSSLECQHPSEERKRGDDVLLLLMCFLISSSVWSLHLLHAVKLKH